MSIKSVTVEHVGTKERHVLPVESFNRGCIFVRWGLSGMYEVNIVNNYIRSCNESARRRNGPSAMKVWRIVDIEVLRKAVWDYYHPKDDSFERHTNNMPYKGSGDVKR